MSDEHDPSYNEKRANNELFVAQGLASPLSDYAVLCEQVNEAVSAIVVEEPTSAGGTIASLVVTRLVLRLLDDLRACTMLAARGYVQ
jgi:hypothetical protein